MLTARQERQVLAFAVLGNVVPILLFVAYRFDEHTALFFVGAAVGMTVPVAVSVLPERFVGARTLFALSGLVGVTMMQAYEGGVASSYAFLIVMPMIWFGMIASDNLRRVGILVMVACCYLPMLLFGAAYPRALVPATVLVLVTSAVAVSLATLRRELRTLTDRLEDEATHDPLTGLFNRRGWEDSSAREMARAGRTGDAVGLVVLDLDGLKLVNDSLGHDRGDLMLVETADRMREVFRADDVVARLGGDEFAVLLSGVSADQMFSSIERLRALTPAQAGFSAGIAVVQPGEELTSAVRRADLALYEAKSAGRGVSLLAEVGADHGPT